MGSKWYTDALRFGVRPDPVDLSLDVLTFPGWRLTFRFLGEEVSWVETFKLESATVDGYTVYWAGQVGLSQAGWTHQYLTAWEPFCVPRRP